MAINKDSNAYTFIFSIVMVVVVGAALAVAAMMLKPFQDKNLENEKKLSILSAFGIETTMQNAADDFTKYVTGGKVLSSDGTIKEEGIDAAFNIDIQKEFKSISSPDERNYPLFECVTSDGEKIFVIPMVGTGLWGPVWGYIALKEDMNTIYGANFGHKGETPGLGAEIDKPAFYDQLKNKEVFLNDEVRLSVVKNGKGTDYAKYDVDGISGGTITSVGVDEMIKRTLAIYKGYNSSKSE
jgi:Na+-transporting NADH:ubiquinone oxidoreductase subunit C